MRLLTTALIALQAPGLLAAAAEPPDPTKTNFVVFAAARPDDLTELQRNLGLAGNPAVNCRVVVNVSAAVRDDKTVDADAIDWKALEAEIHERVRLRFDGEKNRIEITAAYYGRRPDEANRRMLYWALKGMAAEWGFDGIDVITVFQADATGWDDSVRRKKAYDQIAKGQEAEPATGGEFVTVYPVRTPYSRLVLGDVDCVVEIKRPFEADDDGALSDEQTKAVVRAVDGLRLASRGRVCFRIRTKPDAVKAGRAFSNETGKELANRLGFKHYQTTWGAAD